MRLLLGLMDEEELRARADAGDDHAADRLTDLLAGQGLAGSTASGLSATR
jgi:hypothetical protein